jgi:hypothetical protein
MRDGSFSVSTVGVVRIQVLVLSKAGRVSACLIVNRDRLCGIVVRVSGYRYRGRGFDSQSYQIF